MKPGDEIFFLCLIVVEVFAVYVAGVVVHGGLYIPQFTWGSRLVWETGHGVQLGNFTELRWR